MSEAVEAEALYGLVKVKLMYMAVIGRRLRKPKGIALCHDTVLLLIRER